MSRKVWRGSRNTFTPRACTAQAAEQHGEEAREFRKHKRGFVDYRCHHCQRTYNLYTGTIFAGSNLAPRRVVLLVRGICKGEPATVLAEELALSRQCVHRWRKRLQANGYTNVKPPGVTGSRDRNR